jgi:hypothetical protein
MADLLDSIRTQIDARIAELRPLVAEAGSLEAALEALDGPARTTAPGALATRERGEGTGPGRARTRRGETRARVIDHVRGNPGSTAGDVARALRLNRNTVATRLTQLAKSGELVKTDRGYRAA